MQVKAKLQGVSVFEVSRVLEALENVQAKSGSSLDEWKKKIIQAVFACNEDLFQRTVSNEESTVP